MNCMNESPSASFVCWSAIASGGGTYMVSRHCSNASLSHCRLVIAHTS